MATLSDCGRRMSQPTMHQLQRPTSRVCPRSRFRGLSRMAKITTSIWVHWQRGRR